MDLIRKMASLILPSSMLEYFEVVKVEESSTLIEISLDELYPVEYKNDPNIESKGFMSSTTITDFPIRDHKLQLHVRRRRWIKKDDGEFLPSYRPYRFRNVLLQGVRGFFKRNVRRVPQ